MVFLPTAARSAEPDKSTTQPIVRVTLRGARHANATGRRAREMAWQWVASKWPRLMPDSTELARDRFARILPGQRLASQFGPDPSKWTLTVAFEERNGARTWQTQIDIADGAEADTLCLQTVCTRKSEAPAIIAPPSLLGTWVERLDLQDGPFSVLGEPRDVREDTQLQAFFRHVLSPFRRLPVIALTHRPRSRYFGVDPQGLATTVRGMAHVVCVAPDIAPDVARRLGPEMGVVPGAARVYRAGFRPGADPLDHPLLRASLEHDGPNGSKSAFRRALCQAICAWSVEEDAACAPQSFTPVQACERQLAGGLTPPFQTSFSRAS